MQFRNVLYLVLLLNMGCNGKHSTENSYKPQPLAEEGLADKKSESQECVVQKDPSIEIFMATEQWAEKKGVLDHYQVDPGFMKWCIIFHEFPGNPPYCFQSRRLAKPIPDRFYPCPEFSPEYILETKNRNLLIRPLVSVRGFLPGENVTYRLSGKDGHREITFCPRPLLLKKKTGELLAKATLLSCKFGSTLYKLDICGIGNEEKYKFVSNSEGEILSHDLQGPIESTICPEVIGKAGGYANISLHFEDGTFYSMELPWGEEFSEYGVGNK